MAVRLAGLVRRKYKEFEIKAKYSEDDISRRDPVTKATLYKGHAQLEGRIRKSVHLSFLDPPRKDWGAIGVSQGGKTKLELARWTKPTKKMNVGAESVVEIDMLRDAPEAKSKFDVEQFTDEDFEFLQMAKKTTERMRTILSGFLKEGCVLESKESMGSQNPSKTIFFGKNVINCESRKTSSQRAARLLAKKTLEDYLHKQPHIKKKTVSRSNQPTKSSSDSSRTSICCVWTSQVSPNTSSRSADSCSSTCTPSTRPTRDASAASGYSAPSWTRTSHWHA